MKTYIELTNEALSKIYNCTKTVEGQAVNQSVDLVVQAMLDSGVSAAIARALYLKMEANPAEEVSIVAGPFTYGLAIRKAGEESLSLNPTFTLTDEKKLLAMLSEFEDKPGKLAEKSTIESIAELIDDELLIDTIIHCCKLEEYDTNESVWIAKKNDADKGVEIDAVTAKIVLAVHIATILHVLAVSKNEQERAQYEVPGEGTYTIESKKGKWEIGFVAGKEFKQAIKNDRLLEAMAK